MAHYRPERPMQPTLGDAADRQSGSGSSTSRSWHPVSENRWVLGTANLTMEMAVGSQLSVTVSEGDL